MTDLPKSIYIQEEGPREGFQIEPAVISTEDKVRFIEALAETGVRKINCVAFVNPKVVPGWADAEEVAKLINKRPGVTYSSLWLNSSGIFRALELPLDLVGIVQASASETFSIKNANMTTEKQLDSQRRWIAIYKDNGIALDWGYVMTAFGCNFEGDIAPGKVVETIKSLLDVVSESGESIKGIMLSDTVGHATPLSVERVVGAVRERWPDLALGAHLHDTRGTGLANVWAAMNLGVTHFDSSCGGLGGCPFAGNAGSAGNICTEDLVNMCEEMGVSTGIDLESMIECARMAETLVGHKLPSRMLYAH